MRRRTQEERDLSKKEDDLSKIPRPPRAVVRRLFAAGALLTAVGGLAASKSYQIIARGAFAAALTAMSILLSGASGRTKDSTTKTHLVAGGRTREKIKMKEPSFVSDAGGDKKSIDGGVDNLPESAFFGDDSAVISSLGGEGLNIQYGREGENGVNKTLLPDAWVDSRLHEAREAERLREEAAALALSELEARRREREREWAAATLQSAAERIERAEELRKREEEARVRTAMWVNNAMTGKATLEGEGVDEGGCDENNALEGFEGEGESERAV